MGALPPHSNPRTRYTGDPPSAYPVEDPKCRCGKEKTASCAFAFSPSNRIWRVNRKSTRACAPAVLQQPTPAHHITIMRTPLLLVILALLSSTLRADEYFPPPDSQGGWRTLNDAAQIRQLAGMH